MFSRSFALITFSTTLLSLNTACEELEGEALPTDDTAAYDYANEEELEAELLDEETLGEEAEEQAVVWTLGSICSTSGSIDTGWVSEVASSGHLDKVRAQLSWSGSSTGRNGFITVNVVLDMYSYLPKTQSASGVIVVNGVTCGTASLIDRDGTSTGRATSSCKVAWTPSSSPTVTVTMADSSKGTRWEILRDSGTHQMYTLVTGESETYCN